MVDANWRVLYVVISFNCLNSYHDVHLCLRWSSMSDFDGWHEHHKVSNHSWRIIRVLFFQDRLLRSLAGRFAPKARLVVKIFVNMFRKLLLRSSKPPLKFKPPQVCISDYNIIIYGMSMTVRYGYLIIHWLLLPISIITAWLQYYIKFLSVKSRW